MPDPMPPRLPADDQTLLHPTHPGAADWTAIEAGPDFRRLVKTKRGFIVPATLFFILYYFALPLLVGYFPGMMETDVFGQINVAYLFALSQFAMAWALMWMYVRRARTFDRLEHEIVRRHPHAGGEA
jgi:uncharacterized membrane protein (DUF485 family)